jgi:hypothetical protein
VWIGNETRPSSAVLHLLLLVVLLCLRLPLAGPQRVIQELGRVLGTLCI